MKLLNWRSAKLYELYEIGFNDPEAPIMYVQQARLEIDRRRRKQFKQVQHKIKPNYRR